VSRTGSGRRSRRGMRVVVVLGGACSLACSAPLHGRALEEQAGALRGGGFGVTR
jgi:hypothetical protein